MERGRAQSGSAVPGCQRRDNEGSRGNRAGRSAARTCTCGLVPAAHRGRSVGQPTAPSGGGLQNCPVGRPRATAGEAPGRAAAAVATDGTQPRFPSPPGVCQLAVCRRAPPPSNSSACASAPITGRAGTGVRSATIENCTAAALGVAARVPRGPDRDGHRHGARGRGRDRRHVASVVPLQLRRAAEAGHRLREGDRDGEGSGDRGAGVAADGHRRRRGVRVHAAQLRPAAGEQCFQRVPFARVDRQLVFKLDGDDALGVPVALFGPVHSRVRDHSLPVERGGDPRARAADRGARVTEDDEALRPDGGHGDGRRDRADRDLNR